MKFYGLLFTLLLLSGLISTTYAHPYLESFTVQNQDGTVLYESEFGIPEKNEPKSLEWFTEEWVYHNFISILTIVISTAIIGVGVIIYREEITPKISKIMTRY